MSIYNKVYEDIYGYETKNKEGFVNEEIDDLLKRYPDINIEKFDNVLTGITCMIIDGQMVIYHCDIFNAIMCGIENRDQKLYEWD
jgi:hypothetical protein